MWHDLGPVECFTLTPLTTARVGKLRVVVTYQAGQFGVLSGVCDHAGGPLADGRLDGEYVVCPWHNWKYHCRTGLGEPGFEADGVPRYGHGEPGQPDPVRHDPLPRDQEREVPHAKAERGGPVRSLRRSRHQRPERRVPAQVRVTVIRLGRQVRDAERGPVRYEMPSAVPNWAA